MYTIQPLSLHSCKMFQSRILIPPGRVVTNLHSALRPHFAALEDDGDGLQLCRAYACEVVAWRLTTHLSEREAIEYLLYELPEASAGENRNPHADPESGRVTHGIKYDGGDESSDVNEGTRLLAPRNKRVVSQSPSRAWATGPDDASPADFSAFVHNFEGLNALEIAAVCEAKKFLCQRPVQRIVNGIWCGDIVFWESMSVHTVKKAQFHDPKYVSWQLCPSLHFFF